MKLKEHDLILVGKTYGGGNPFLYQILTKAARNLEIPFS
jgi:hypothetical protein